MLPLLPIWNYPAMMTASFWNAIRYRGAEKKGPSATGLTCSRWEEELQFPMKTRHRELKIALVDNQDESFDVFFLPQNMELFVSTPRRIFQDFRSSSSQRPGISTDYERDQALAYSGTLRAPRIQF